MAQITAEAILWLAATFASVLADPGNHCSLPHNRIGVCVPLEHCEEVKQEIKEGKTPIMCHSDKFVCCPQPEGAISRQKCKDYARLVYVEELEAWTLGDEKVNRSLCPHDGGVTLIIGGEPALGGEFPHMALLGYGKADNITWACGGSLISERWVLTAAHCITFQGMPPGWVLLGDIVLDSTSERSMPKTYKISRIAIHPEYSYPSHYNDIALVQLEENVQFSEFVRPACLHTSRTVSISEGVATGWGTTDPNVEKIHNELQKVSLPLRRAEECVLSYKPLVGTRKLRHGYKDDTMMCIGDPSRPKDTCKGDSGGPFQMLLQTPHCMFDVMAVTSFGRACAVEHPAVYSRVSWFVSWIESVVWPSH